MMTSADCKNEMIAVIAAAAAAFTLTRLDPSQFGSLYHFMRREDVASHDSHRHSTNEVLNVPKAASS